MMWRKAEPVNPSASNIVSLARRGSSPKPRHFQFRALEGNLGSPPKKFGEPQGRPRPHGPRVRRRRFHISGGRSTEFYGRGAGIRTQGLHVPNVAR